MPTHYGMDARGPVNNYGGGGGGGMGGMMGGLMNNPVLRETLGKLLMRQSQPQQQPLYGAANPQTGGGYNSLRSGESDTQIPSGGLPDEAGMDYGAMAKKVAPGIADAVGDLGDQETYELGQQPQIQIPSQMGASVPGQAMPQPTARPLRNPQDTQSAFQALKGGGQITEIEGQLLQSIPPQLASTVMRIKEQYGNQYSIQEIMKYLQTQGQ